MILYSYGEIGKRNALKPHKLSVRVRLGVLSPAVLIYFTLKIKSMNTAITIKPLTWKFISNDFWESKAIGIMFLVYYEDDGWLATFVSDCDAANGEWGETFLVGSSSYKTEKEAKDACQIKFNEMISDWIFTGKAD